MDEKALRTIIEQVLSEMKVDGAAPAAAAATGCDKCAAVVEEGCIPDLTEVDIRTQYLVKNPENGEAFAELKANAPCRLGIGKAGARYLTDPQLEFRAAHSAAQDAVFTDVDPELVEKLNLFTVQTQCDCKDTYLTRPDLGRKLSDEGIATIKEKCKKNPTVQIYVADGLSSAAVAANIPDLLPAIVQGLQSYKIDTGTPFFVKYGRVAVMNPEIVGRSVETICKLAGLDSVPAGKRVLVARETGVGRGHPYSNEKLAPILAFFTGKDYTDVCEKVCEILHYEGAGHTFSIHTQDDKMVDYFARRVPASRIMVNTPSALGGIGGTTGLMPALTLGCGAVGGSATSENVGPMPTAGRPLS